MLIVNAWGHGEAGGCTWQKIKRRARQSGAFALPKMMPHQRPWTTNGDDLEYGAEAQDETPMLRTAIVFSKK
jgi:hypothetical protein